MNKRALKQTGIQPAALVLLLLLQVMAELQTTANAYPQFQKLINKHTTRATNCAVCHANENGPNGDAPGQMGSLNKEELLELRKAKAAMLPGQHVNNPSLNAFGNQIIYTLGRTRVMEMVSDPEQLPLALGYKSDLDGDGIPDSAELLDGTNPLNKVSGDPWKLFCVNIKRNWAYELMAVIAALAVSYGISHVLRGLAAAKHSDNAS